MKNFVPINLDIYEFFAMYAKKARDSNFAAADMWLDGLLRKIKSEAHIKQGQVFCYDIEKNGWYNWLCPFHRINEAEDPDNKGFYDLGRNAKNYFKYLKGFLRVAAKMKFLFIPIFFPRSYGEKPFLKNINGVSGYLDERGWKHQRRIVKKIMRLWRAAYGRKTLWAKPTNEIGHANWPQGVEVAWWFEKIYSWISDNVPLNRLIMDTSHSDFNKVCDRSVLTEGGELMSFQAWAGMTEKPPLAKVKNKPAIFPSVDYPRKGWPEAPHGVNLWTLQRPAEGETGKTLWESYQSPSWRQHSLSGDGNSEGSGYCIPGQDTFRELSKEELYEYYYFIFKYRAENPRSAKFLMGLFPMHIFIREPNGYVHGDLDRLNFEWLKQPWEAWVKAGMPKMY